MTGRPDHLTDEAGAILTASIDERVYFVRSKRWIAYPKAVEILGHLIPKAPLTDSWRGFPQGEISDSFGRGRFAPCHQR